MEAPSEDLEDPTIAVARWVAILPDRLRAVYEVLYEQRLTQRQAAAIMRVTQPRIAQLHKAILRRGRAELAEVA